MLVTGFVMLAPAQTVFVVEPAFGFGLGAQNYSYQTLTAEGTFSTIYAWESGLRFSLYDFQEDGFPLGVIVSAVYMWQELGYYNTLGREYSSDQIRVTAMASWPLIKGGGIMAVNAGVYYSHHFWGNYDGHNVTEENAVPSADVLSGDIGLRLEYYFSFAFDYNQKEKKPELIGIGMYAFLDINLVDITVLQDENLTYWQFGIGFTIPIFL